MFSGEIGSLQPRTSYAVARTIGSTEMARTRLHAHRSNPNQNNDVCRSPVLCSSRVWQAHSSELPRSPHAGVNLVGVGDWAIGSSRAGLSLAARLTAVEIS
jgi:hypothetical protein